MFRSALIPSPRYYRASHSHWRYVLGRMALHPTRFPLVSVSGAGPCAPRLNGALCSRAVLCPTRDSPVFGHKTALARPRSLHWFALLLRSNQCRERGRDSGVRFSPRPTACADRAGSLSVGSIGVRFSGCALHWPQHLLCPVQSATPRPDITEQSHSTKRPRESPSVGLRSRGRAVRAENA